MFRVSASIGVAGFSGGVQRMADVVRKADAACYLAKGKGRNRVVVHTTHNRELAGMRNEACWISRIQAALDEDRLVLYAQKIVPLAPAADGIHVELLLRIKDEQGRLVPPGAFIPAAERYGIMRYVDRWVVGKAFAHYRHAAGGAPPSVIAINLSADSLADDEFPAALQHMMRLHRVDPSRFCFEITETSAIANLAGAAELIRELKAFGCRFSLDDFGCGMSSFSYLKHLPVDYLKIDGSFVRDLTANLVDRAMVEAINHVGHVMGIQTIAECAEDAQTLAALQQVGVDFAQGYGVERPQPWYDPGQT
jgi:EAL domain-containing protein (putative c-di-GMP-specific phosphodiesterase class I)